MKQFFTDKQVRKFTLKEKFEYIFKQLSTTLQPTEVPYQYNYITIGPKYIYGPIHTKRIPIYSINKKGIDLITKITLLFDGINVSTEKINDIFHKKVILIKIEAQDFCYKFPPEMIPEIWRRLKRIK